MVSISKFKEFEPKCDKCGSTCRYIYSPTVPQVAFKDGPSGSWPTKGAKFKKYRAKRNEEMKKRQRDRYGEKKEAIPNYKGVECGSWEEAQNMASKDNDRDDRIRKKSINTFKDRVAKEKKSKPTKVSI